MTEAKQHLNRPAPWTRFIAPFLIAPLVFTAIFAGACTQKTSPEPQIGKAYYIFEDSQVVEVAVTEQSPGKTPWLVRTQRTAASTDVRPEWAIVSAPVALSESTADAGFVLHLVDTLHTLWAIEPAPSGPLSGLGLEPAWRILQWKTADGKVFELRLGDQVKPGGRAARFSPDTGAYLTEGAALRMLAHLDDWEALRKRTLVQGTRDDVDLIEISAPGKPKIEASRNAEDWETPKQKPYPNAFSEQFDRFVHQRILKFLDSPEDARSAVDAAAQAKPTRIVFKDRLDRPQTIEIFSRSGRWFGRNSQRGNVWFELYPEVGGNLSDWIQAASTARKSGTK